MIVEILGKGCPKCMALEKNVKNALMDLNKEAEIKHIKDINKIAEYGVMITPALVIDGQVKSSGKVLSPEEIKEYLRS
jgi:small redox-active disulfide protein 2